MRGAQTARAAFSNGDPRRELTPEAVLARVGYIPPMPLAASTRLGNYEIVTPLGAGSMGEVYRARATKLGREVALKVLPGEVSSRTG